MTDAGSSIRISRLVLMGLVVGAPLCGSGSVNFMLIIVSAVCAYDGLHGATVYGIMGALIVTELIYGMDVGVISVAYMIAVLLIASLSRIVTIAPTSSELGWHVVAGARSFIIACGFFVTTSILSVLLGGALYGYEDVALRLRGLADPRSIVLAVCGLLLTLVVLRRIDEPFRRRILFGT